MSLCPTTRSIRAIASSLRSPSVAAHLLAGPVAQFRPQAASIRKPPQASSSSSPAFWSARAFSATPPPAEASDLSEVEYDRVAEATMETLHEGLEELVEGPDGAKGGWEVEYSSGVLTLSMGDHGTYVINKQPPNKEIWLSSPLSGPKRFAYSSADKLWYFRRDRATTLGGLMDGELSEMTGKPVSLDLDSA